MARLFLLHMISFLLLGALITGGVFIWYYNQYKSPGPLAQETYFVVHKGQGVAVIADRLKGAGVITDPALFRFAARLSESDKNLKAGEYRLETGISIEDILQKLTAGDVFLRQFTVPEGFTSWQVVQVLNKMEELKGDVSAIPPEGSLLPETYSFQRGDARQDKIAQMQKAMRDVLEQLWNEKGEHAPDLSKEQVITLASIVEKETAVPEERRRVAGVFVNRLNKGIALQTDPTVIYALTRGKIQDSGKGPLGRRLLRKDLQIDSPYNTYKYPGLPPGPIANPGRASIEAVLNPEKHDYYYFVADGTGGHVFSKTLAEHNANVSQWRKIRKQSGK